MMSIDVRMAGSNSTTRRWSCFILSVTAKETDVSIFTSTLFGSASRDSASPMKNSLYISIPHYTFPASNYNPPVTATRDTRPIAIVGIAHRLPGAGGQALSSADALWQALLHGRDLVSSVEPTRWAQDSCLHPRKSEPGSAYTFAAGSIGDVAGFDAAFFGISPREAAQMDPQQRVLLEIAWEALESAGIPPSSIRSSRWGVYLGVSSLDYAYRRADDMASIDATTMTGNAASIAANRISYVFDLRGPSMVVDTACSSALVAFHQACQSIRC